jgi:hypothetical protein
MRFDRESWRKLYVAESMQHRLMPVLCRGLRDYLLRHAGEDGTLLSRTEDPARDLAKVLGAHESESNLVETYVLTWLDEGYLKHSRGRLYIAKYEEAQNARSQGAIRQERYIAKKKASPGDVTTDADADAKVTSPGDGDLTSQIIDETRRDETRQQINRDVAAVFEAWREATDHPRAKLDDKRSKRIRARLAEGFTAEQLILAVRNWKLDDWLSGKNPDREVYDGIETLLRDAAQVEKLSELHTKNGAGVIEIQ